MTLDEAKEATGLTHWNQTVVDQKETVVDEGEAVEAQEAAEDAPESTNDSVVTVEVIEEEEAITEDDKALVAEARALQTGIGYKTPEYLKFVDANKDLIPNEYEIAKNLIARYL